MKIVKFAPAFSRSSQTFIYGLACALQHHLSDLRVLTLERENAALRPFDPVDVLDEVIPAPEEHRLPLWVKVLGGGERETLTEQLVQYLLHHEPDLVHAHFGPAGAMRVDACEAVGIPLVVSLRGYDASRLMKEGKWRRVYRDLFPRIQALVLITDEMESRVRHYCENTPIVTIHAGKKVDDYPYGAPRRPIRRFLSIGRLVEKKGHDDTIRAIAHARQTGLDVSLQLVGDGEDRPLLEGLIDDLDAGGFVQLLGRLPHDEVKDLMAESDAFVLACRTASDGDKEGVPNVLKEAQLIGLPVLTTRHAGIPAVIPKTQHRWLVDERDWQALSWRIEDLARRDLDDLRAHTERARAHVAMNFSREGEVLSHLKLYDRIINPPRKQP